MKLRSLLAAGSVAGLVLAGVSAAPASAELVTRCVGTAGAVTVPGDLVVPKGESCVLEGTTVEGKVTVRQDANLIVNDATFHDRVVVAENGYLDVTGGQVEGAVVSRGGYGVYLDAGALGAGLSVSAPKDQGVQPFLFADHATIARQVRAAAGTVTIDNSRVGGAVTGTGTTYVDVVNSTVGGAVSVTDNEEGSFICASEINKDATFTGSRGVQLGGGTLLADCDQVNYFGGDVTVSDNTGGVQVNGNIIAGALSGDGNDPAPTGGNNRVRGGTSGQFSELPPTPQAAAAAEAQRADPASRATQRRQQATQRADAAGPAHL